MCLWRVIWAKAVEYEKQGPRYEQFPIPWSRDDFAVDGAVKKSLAAADARHIRAMDSID